MDSSPRAAQLARLHRVGKSGQGASRSSRGLSSFTFKKAEKQETRGMLGRALHNSNPNYVDPAVAVFKHDHAGLSSYGEYEVPPYCIRKFAPRPLGVNNYAGARPLPERCPRPACDASGDGARVTRWRLARRPRMRHRHLDTPAARGLSERPLVHRCRLSPHMLVIGRELLARPWVESLPGGGVVY